jgi:hypothetical protein
VSRPDATALREAWQRLHLRVDVTAALSPDFLRRDLAYRQQVARHGGLSARAQQRLATLAGATAHSSATSASPSPRLKPGSTLLREWQGRTYTVLALEAGFELAGQRFRSLSEVAQHITGAHWSGPRFFGLRRAGGPPVPRPTRSRLRDA